MSAVTTPPAPLPDAGGEERWHEANQRALTAAIADVRDALERHLDAHPDHGTAAARPGARRDAAGTTGENVDWTGPASALDVVAQAFGLSPFERAVLVLTAAVELDGSVGALCAACRGEQGWAEATFGMALAALPDPHWSALAPSSPLRRWELVHLAGSSLTTSALRIDERVLHHLAGVGGLYGGLDGLLVAAASAPLAPSQEEAALGLADHWRASVGGDARVANMVGPSHRAKVAVAAAAAAAVGAGLFVLDARWLPPERGELDRIARLLEREAVLVGSAVLIDADEVDEPDRQHLALTLAQRTSAPVVLATRERMAARGRTDVVIQVERPTSAEQWDRWGAHLDDEELVDSLVGQFDLDAEQIDDIATSDDGAAGRSWEACRVQARPRLGALAQRVQSGATWDDLVLPPAPLELLRQVLIDVRHRFAVYDRWGMGRGRTRGVGTSVLFSGPSGTGKTLAAEVLATELGLDLYRIDLSGVVSKYIGETEKNLSRVFDAAESGGAVLLFDEADALFGKRTEVTDSHDRYANTEIAYLLQRVDEHRGLAILTTNMRDALDGAFLRRLRFVIDFPFPDRAQREAIWRQAFPPATPTADVDVARLAELSLSGGSIRNAATAAAFLAADAHGPVEMTHIVQAMRLECAKLDLPVGRMLEEQRR